MMRWALLLLSCVGAGTSAQEAPTPVATRTTQRVLLIGNSLIYTNNLPGLLRSFARAQDGGPRIDTASYVMPGAELQDHLRSGQALAALEAEHFDVLVLQERGGLLACLATVTQKDEVSCRNSVRAHKRFAEAAKARGTRVLLMGTWGPDGDYQDRLDRGLRQIARETGATPVFLGARLRDYQASHRDAKLFTDESLHPSLIASLMLAAGLYREVSGQRAQAANLLLDFPLLPPGSRMGDNLPLERNDALNALAKPVTLSAAELPPLIEAAEAP